MVVKYVKYMHTSQHQRRYMRLKSNEQTPMTKLSHTKTLHLCLIVLLFLTKWQLPVRLILPNYKTLRCAKKDSLELRKHSIQMTVCRQH